MRLLRSGGTREDENGRQIACFLRQDPSQISEAALINLILEGTRPGEPFASMRKGLSPSGYLQAFPQNGRTYPSRREAMEGASSATLTRLTKVTYLDPSDESKRALRDGHVARSGKIFVQAPNSYDEYDVFFTPLYSGRERARPVGSVSCQPLPTHWMELYQLTKGGPGRTNASVCLDIASIEIFDPENGRTAKAENLGPIARVDTTHCHELGEDFLVLRSTRPLQAPAPGRSRTLVLFADGAKNGDNLAWLPKGPAVAFDAPHEHGLLTNANTTRMPTRTFGSASEHYIDDLGRHVVDLFLDEDQDLSDDQLLDRCAGSDTPGAVGDLLLRKFTRDWKAEGDAGVQAAHDVALNDPKEAAAWYAHETGDDVVLVRKTETFARFRTLLRELRRSGLLNDYVKIRLHVCREKLDGSSPMYGIGRNPVRGSLPVRTAACPVAPENLP